MVQGIASDSRKDMDMHIASLLFSVWRRVLADGTKEGKEGGRVKVGVSKRGWDGRTENGARGRGREEIADGHGQQLLAHCQNKSRW